MKCMESTFPISKCSEHNNLSSIALLLIRKFGMGTLSSVRSMLKATCNLVHPILLLGCVRRSGSPQARTLSWDGCGQQWANLLNIPPVTRFWGTGHFSIVFEPSLFIHVSLDSFSKHYLLLLDHTFWKDAKCCGSCCLDCSVRFIPR